MDKSKLLTGKILKLHGWSDGKIIGLAKNIAEQLADQGLDRETILARLDAVRKNLGAFMTDILMADLARECFRLIQKDEMPDDELRASPLPYPIWGRENIEECSIAQMDNAMRLPISVAGALMPDAHLGYGLPIGGVLATENAVIPYAVGVDSLNRVVLNGFNSLMLCSADGCRPFDAERKGLSLGEGAGAVALERRERLGFPALTVTGWGSSNDANHLTGPSRDGSGLALAMNRALKKAGVAQQASCYMSGTTGEKKSEQ